MIAGHHPTARYAEIYARSGRLHVPDFLDRGTAQKLHRQLASYEAWQLAVNDGEKVWDLSASDFSALPETRQAPLLARVHAGAEQGFQFLFNSARLSEAGECPADNELRDAAALLTATPFLDFCRTVTGCTDIAFADVQATRYLPGHFLTRHDDDIAHKQRRAAYVLNLTSHWRAEWGGVLEFLDADGHVAEGYVPCFNALNLFCVPQLHHVSYVAPFAAVPRLSLTGWLRAKP